MEKIGVLDITTEILDRDKDTDIMYRIVETLKETYSTRLARTILFGSQRDDSEELWTGIEIIVFLDDMKDRWAETQVCMRHIRDLSLEFGLSVLIIPFDSSLLDIKLKPRFLEQVIEKGVTL